MTKIVWPFACSLTFFRLSCWLRRSCTKERTRKALICWFRSITLLLVRLGSGVTIILLLFGPVECVHMGVCTQTAVYLNSSSATLFDLVPSLWPIARPTTTAHRYINVLLSQLFLIPRISLMCRIFVIESVARRYWKTSSGPTAHQRQQKHNS